MRYLYTYMRAFTIWIPQSYWTRWGTTEEQIYTQQKGSILKGRMNCYICRTIHCGTISAGRTGWEGKKKSRFSDLHVLAPRCGSSTTALEVDHVDKKNAPRSVFGCGSTFSKVWLTRGLYWWRRGMHASLVEL